MWGRNRKELAEDKEYDQNIYEIFCFKLEKKIKGRANLVP